MMIRRPPSQILLPTVESSSFWLTPSGHVPEFDELRSRMADHLRSNFVSLKSELSGSNSDSQSEFKCSDLSSVVFSVPGTLDFGPSSPSSRAASGVPEIPPLEHDESGKGQDSEKAPTLASSSEYGESVVSSRSAVVRNMPSLSREYAGFNFKRCFGPVFPSAKIHAVPDSIAAAMGVATIPEFENARTGFVLTLGTAPSVSTFFRPKAAAGQNKGGKVIELGVWHGWVWFTKIALDDKFGYCGGIQWDDSLQCIVTRPPNFCKMPHEKARIRFAVDGTTWQRLLGQSKIIPPEYQGDLTVEEAKSVWVKRVQSSIDAIANKFHQVYGPPEVIAILGGNAGLCSGKVTTCTYPNPDSSYGVPVRVPVFVPKSDQEQQLIHLSGLAQAANYRTQHVYAAGQDPLNRGWTRGGEVFLWMRRDPAEKPNTSEPKQA